jgi:hypothetical protein
VRFGYSIESVPEEHPVYRKLEYNFSWGSGRSLLFCAGNLVFVNRRLRRSLYHRGIFRFYKQGIPLGFFDYRRVGLLVRSRFSLENVPEEHPVYRKLEYNFIQGSGRSLLFLYGFHTDFLDLKIIQR